MRKVTRNLAQRWIGCRCWRRPAAVREAAPPHRLTMVVPLARAVPLALLLQYLLFLTCKSRVWCGFRDRNTHGLTEAQAREIITKLRQGIGVDFDSLIARVGAMRVRNTKIIYYLKTPSLSSCKQIREAMNAFIEKENV